MLYEAAHLASDGESLDAARRDPNLARYVARWGQPDDAGWIAFASQTGQMLGAAWFSLLCGENRGYGYVADDIPELVIATCPSSRGQGAGTSLLAALIEHARPVYPGLSLSVRDDNPAVRLYGRFGFENVPGSDVENRAGGRSHTMVCRFYPGRALREI